MSTSSIWTTTLPRLPSFPGGNLRPHTAVIGAGFTGLSVAYHLLTEQPQRQVIVLEARHVGSGASLRNTGMITPGVGQNLTALIKRVGRDQARAMYLATLQAVRYVSQLAERENFDCHLQMTGQLIVAQGPQGPSRLAKLAHELETLELPCQRLNADTLAQLITLPSPVKPSDSSLPVALRLPVAGTLHPGLLIKGLIQAIQQRGGEIYEQAQVLEVSNGIPTTLSLANGKVIADHVILATGGYTPTLGLLRGRILPVHIQALATEPLEHAALQTLGWNGRECIIDSRRLFNYYRLTADNRLVFGGRIPRYYWGGRTTEDSGERHLNSLLAEFHQTFGRTAKVATHWTGVIDYVLDAMPVIGPLRDYPTVFYVGGWCGHGIALSLSAGKWVAQLLNSGKPLPNLPWCRDRPPLLPSELLRWIGFQGVVNWMIYQDSSTF